MYLLTGYFIGLGTVIFIGPVLFTLLKATWNNGHKSGISVALGIIVSDIIVVGVCYFGSAASSSLVDKYVPKFWIGMFGAALLLALAVKYILQPGSSLLASVTTKADHPLAFFGRGFLINTLNPSVFVVWIAIIENYSKKIWLWTGDGVISCCGAVRHLLHGYDKSFYRQPDKTLHDPASAHPHFTAA